MKRHNDVEVMKLDMIAMCSALYRDVRHERAQEYVREKRYL